MNDPAAAKTPPRTGSLRRFLVRAIVAVLAVLLVKSFACDYYPVEEQSMWPALEGKGAASDRVLVDKVAAMLGSPERFEIWVFRHDVGGTEVFFVKRVLGLGGEAIDFKGGDVHIVPPGGTEGSLAARPSALVESQMMGVPAGRGMGAPLRAADFDVKGGRLSDAGSALELVPDPAGGTVSATLRAGAGPQPHCIRDDHVGGAGRHAVPDVRITSGPIRLDSGSLAFIHELGGGELRKVALDRAGISVTARVGGAEDVRARFPSVPCEHGIRMETLDGVFRVLLPEGGGWRELFSEPRDTSTPEGNSLVRLEAAGKPVLIKSLEVTRDVHYVWGDSPSHPHPLSGPQPIPNGRLFVVGDNPEISRDSRDPGFGAVRVGDLVGLVRAVVWPFGRRRIPK